MDIHACTSTQTNSLKWRPRTRAAKKARRNVVQVIVVVQYLGRENTRRAPASTCISLPGRNRTTNGEEISSCPGLTATWQPNSPLYLQVDLQTMKGQSPFLQLMPSIHQTLFGVQSSFRTNKVYKLQHISSKHIYKWRPFFESVGSSPLSAIRDDPNPGKP